jgi:hypothetical protein
MSRKKAKQIPKRVLRLPDLDFARSAVLNTLRSAESKRSCRFAIDGFVAWYCPGSAALRVFDRGQNADRELKLRRKEQLHLIAETSPKLRQSGLHHGFDFRAG